MIHYSIRDSREERGKMEGREREERVKKALSELLSRFVFPLPFPLSSLALP
jgi:hypothetical protein